MNLLKHAFRQLRLRPGLSVIVIAMLALGIGATTAMFSLYHQILVRPLPVPEPDRLVNLSAPGPKPGGRILDTGLSDFEAQISYPLFRDLEERQTVFTGLAAYTDFLANVSFDDQPVSGSGWLVSGSYFDVLGLEAALGRLIGPEDEPRVGEAAVAVLDHAFWQNRLGGDPGVIGETLTVNGQALEIVGVAPADFAGTNVGARRIVFVPLTLGSAVMSSLAEYENRLVHWLYLFGRLAPGVTLERAAAGLNGLYSGILSDIEAPLLSGQELPDGMLERFLARQIELSPGARGKSNLPGTAARPLALLLGVTALVLAIVCVNVANLLLARGAARAGEMAIRTSVGASRGALVRQLLAESVVLIAIGGALSLVVARLVLRVIESLSSGGMAQALSPGLDAAALVFAAGASLVTVLVFGLAPAWRVSGANPADAMRGHGTRASGGRGAARFRKSLTTAQIAFSLVLLVLAGLFAKSLANVAREDLGIDVESLVMFSIVPRINGYDDERLAAVYDRVEEALAAEPGVLAVGSAGVPLLSGVPFGATFSVEGFDAAPGADTSAGINMVGADFFDALGAPLLAGRGFREREGADLPGDGSAPSVAIVNESFARRFELGRDVGRRLGFGGSGDYPFEIVGIVADSKQGSLKGEMSPVVYVPRHQWASQIQAMFYYVRTGVDPEALLAAIPRVVAGVDPDVPVSNLRTMTTSVQDMISVDRLLSTLAAGFAVLATSLAGIGLYGVLAYSVSQRTRELGLRLALGADPRRLRAMVLKQVGVMAAIGAGIGLVAALALGRVAESVLFGLSGRDPLVLAGAVAVLAAVVLAGTWLPARRASRIAPTEALRYE